MKVSNVERLKAKLAAMPQAAKDEIRKAMRESAEEIADLARRAAPHKSGALKRSIGYTFGTYRPDNANVRGVTASGGGHDLSVTIHAGDATAWYAALIEFGTAPHVIVPKRRGGLLNIYGRLVKRVNHPGATAQPFFYPAYRLGRKRAKSRIARAVTKAAKKAASGS